MLRSGITTEKKEVPYWFDERHKCWLRLPYVDRSDLTSTKPIDVWISAVPKILNFQTDRQMCLNVSDIEFFNSNPNDNLSLNVEYYKSLHCYKWRMQFKYNGNDDEPVATRITNVSEHTVIVF